MRISVDPAACDGFGYSAELVPELMALDEWGFPVVSQHEVPGELLDAARQASRAPALAGPYSWPARPGGAEGPLSLPGPARSQAERGAARRPLRPAVRGFETFCGCVLHPVRLLIGQPWVAEIRPRRG